MIKLEGTVLNVFTQQGGQNKKGESFNSEILYSNISMESFIFDKKEV